MSKPEELDLAEVTKLPPFMLVGSLMCAIAGAAIASVLGAKTSMAVGSGVAAAALFVGLTLDGFLGRSQTEARWALGFTVALWLAICGALAQTAGFMIFVGAGMIGVGAYLIKRRRCGAKGRQNVTIEPTNVTDGQWQGNLHPLAGWWTTALVAAVFVTAGLLLHVCLPVLATLVGIGWGMVVGIAVFAATYRRGTSGEDVAFFWASIAVIAVSAAVVWAVGLCGLLFAATSFASMLLTLAVRQLNIDTSWI